MSQERQVEALEKEIPPIRAQGYSVERSNAQDEPNV
jgi:DNA-binding IclR family transcriptional regulator